MQFEDSLQFFGGNLRRKERAFFILPWRKTFIFFFLFVILEGCQREEELHRLEKTSLPQETILEEPPDIPPRALLVTEQAFVKVARKVIPSVVNISSTRRFKHPSSDGSSGRGVFRDFFGGLFSSPRTKDFRQRSLGSGFIIHEDGLVLTNYHVIEEAERIIVRLSDQRELVGRVVGKDPKSDLAVIQINPGEPLSAVKMGSSEDLMAGEWAIAIGNPFGLDHTVTVGVVSATGRSNLGLTEYDNFIQTDASINFGNSGGPLLNAKGEVIGINTAIVASGHGIGFAIPINTAQEVIEGLINSGKIQNGWLGIRIREIPSWVTQMGSPDQEPRGVHVEEVLKRSPAQRSGIKKGDRIFLVNRKEVRSVKDFKRWISRLRIGDRLELTLSRRDREIHLEVVLAEPPLAPSVP